MKLYISASNRKKNSYHFLKKIKQDEDIFFSLEDLDIKYCLGCNACQKNSNYSCILNDDMQKIYDAISKCEKIIIMSPIYMNQITGIFKNILDRLNPYTASEALKGKTIYLITVGQMSEEEQKEICNSIKEWFQSISEFLYFDFEYLYNFTSGDVLEVDSINKMYDEGQLNSIIDKIISSINN